MCIFMSWTIASAPSVVNEESHYMKCKIVKISFLTVYLLLFSSGYVAASDMNRSEYRAVGGNIFVGYGLLRGNISEYFTNPIFAGVNVDFHRNRMVIQADSYIGFGKTRKTMVFPDNLEWAKNKPAFHFILGGNLGYTLVNTNTLKFVPLAGIGGHLLSSTFMGNSENFQNEPFIPFYKIGGFIDIKSLRLFRGDFRFNNDDGYTGVRLSFGIKSQIGKRRHYSFYQGNMIYLTIGMGGLSRW